MKRSALFLLILTFAIEAFAQRPRSIEPDKTTPPPPAPETVKAKYEGGVFGYNKAMDGTLTFDDQNHRLLFRKQQKEVFSIPYDAVVSVFADTQKRQPKAATIASAVPLIYALPAHFIKTKVRYLTLQYNDPNTQVSGITSFKLEDKEILTSVLATLAGKAELVQRGEVYVKKKDSDSTRANP